MKRLWSILLMLIVLITVMPAEATAAQEHAAFRYELTVDGMSEKEVRIGDIITVVLHLCRTDAEEDYTMYAMQDEIRYDSNFFELVEGSHILSPGIQTTDIAMRDHYRELYMSFLSLSGGETWLPKKLIGSFQLRVIGTSGVTRITNQDYLVSLQDGSGSYPCQANEVTVILSTDCTVRFESNGGTKVEDVIAVYGETIPRPADPQREGKSFAGWHKDIDCTQEWDFEKDTVTGNMTLYAKWTDRTDGDTQISAPGKDSGNCRFPWWILLIILIIILLLKRLFQKKESAH